MRFILLKIRNKKEIHWLGGSPYTVEQKKQEAAVGCKIDIVR